MAVTTNYTWKSYQSGTTSNATSYDVSSNGNIWHAWIDSGTGCQSTADAWVQWTTSTNSATTNTVTYHTPAIHQQMPPPKTPEQVAAEEEAQRNAQLERERREAELREECRKRTELANLAKVRAEELLLSLLNARQRREYKLKRQISIYDGRVLKWILKVRDTYNVVECKDGKPIKQHCVITRDTPLADQLATQYLYLRSGCVEELIRVANHQPVVEPH